MEELKSISALVERILKQEHQTRNSDSLLYLRVIEAVAERDGWRKDLPKLTVYDFLLTAHALKVPGFETVRRARQRCQASNPELSAYGKVKEHRQKNERKYRAFARGDSE